MTIIGHAIKKSDTIDLNKATKDKLRKKIIVFDKKQVRNIITRVTNQKEGEIYRNLLTILTHQL